MNLHYLHVNRDKKGRTCRACHETHASNAEKHIRDSVPFGKGGWELPIGFEKTASGGSCSPGCHKPIGYDRDRAVEYGETGDGDLAGGESVGTAGVAGVRGTLSRIVILIVVVVFVFLRRDRRLWADPASDAIDVDGDDDDDHEIDYDNDHDCDLR